MSREELSEPLRLFREILACPHGDLDKTLEVHRDIMQRNPLFYVKAAAWYIENGTVRDHKVAFVRTLFTADQPALRDAGWMLLQELPLELVHRVIPDKYPRSLRSAVIHYLASMDEDYLKYHILRGAKALRRTVRRLHIPTLKSGNPNLQLIGRELFSKSPELRAIFKKLHDAEDPEIVAEILRESRLPSYIAVSALRVRTPEIMRVLIERMTPSELLQSLNSLGRLRVIKPNLELILSKIRKAIEDRRISAMRVHRIRRHLDPTLVPSEIFDLLTQVTVRKIRKISKIKGKVSIHVDTSGSMHIGIDIARKLATTLSIAAEEPPTVYTACATPTKVVPDEYTPEGWERAFDLISVGGFTPLGAGIALMKQLGDPCDTLIMITDEGENTPPYFVNEYQTLSEKPIVIVVRVGAERRTFTEVLTRHGIPHHVIEVETADQYSLDQIVRLIGKSSPFEVVLEIMQTSIPRRPPETKMPNYWRMGS